MTETRDDFLAREYEALRTEMVQMISDARALERYIVTGCAAVWAWVAVHPESPKISLALPLVLAVLGGVRDRTYAVEIGGLGEYLRRIEEHFLPEGGAMGKARGWEHHQDTRNVSGESPYLLWGILLVAGLLALWQLPTGHKAAEAETAPCVINTSGVGSQAKPAAPSAHP